MLLLMKGDLIVGYLLAEVETMRKHLLKKSQFTKTTAPVGVTSLLATGNSFQIDE
jgi:hypothetical protein